MPCHQLSCHEFNRFDFFYNSLLPFEKPGLPDPLNSIHWTGKWYRDTGRRTAADGILRNNRLDLGRRL
jgi:hypothetical protein